MIKDIKQKNILYKINGITLIALVITIIVLLILAGVTISALSGDNGILTNASKAKYATELSQYNEELQLFKSNKVLENIDFEGGSLVSAENSLDYNTKPAEETGNIYNVIPSLEGSHFDGKLEVIKGELLLNSQDKAEIEVAQSVGIAVNPYEITDEGELVSSNGNLLLMDEETGTLRLPESITSIGEGAFANLEGLKTIIIPGTVKEIKMNAFRANKDLETVIIEEGVEIIRTSAFKDCENLISVSLPESLTNIEGEVFMQCHKLPEIKIPSKIEIIENNLFYDCNNLKNIQLPANLKQIGSCAFFNCNLEKIKIPDNVTYIGISVFDNCNNLEDIIIENNPNFQYENGILMNSYKDNIIFISSKVLNNITTFEIPEGIKAFSTDLHNYSNIQKLIIPASLESISIADGILPNNLTSIEINNNNLYMCIENDCLYSKDKKRLLACFTQGKNVQLYNNVEEICPHSFDLAKNLIKIDLPESVKKIGGQVFTNSKVQTVTIGKNLESIDPIFKYLNYSTEIIIDKDNPNFTIEDKILYNKDKTELVVALKEIKGSFTVKDGIKKIETKAFHNQSNMTEIILPEGLTEIGSSFNYCYGLTEIIIPSSVETIDTNCFNYANNLEKIKVNKPKDTIDGSPWGANKGDRIVEWQE